MNFAWHIYHLLQLLIWVDIRLLARTGERGWRATWHGEFDTCTNILFCLSFEVEMSPTRTRGASLVMYRSWYVCLCTHRMAVMPLMLIMFVMARMRRHVIRRVCELASASFFLEQLAICASFKWIVCADSNHFVDRCSEREQPHGEWAVMTLVVYAHSFYTRTYDRLKTCNAKN